MEMIGHDHEIVKQIFTLSTVVKKNFDKQIGGGIPREYGFALSGHGCDEKCTIHPLRLGIWHRERYARNHVEIVQLREQGQFAVLRPLSQGVVHRG